MKTGLGGRVIFILALLLSLHLAAGAQGYYPATDWARVDTREAGFSAESFELVKKYAQTMDSVAGIILYDGKVVFDWGDTKKKGNVHSVRKSFMSALYGVYSAEGSIYLEASLQQLKIDDTPPSLSDAEKKARVVDLLRARSGVYHEAAYETEAMKRNRPPRGSHAHDSFWYYNNWDFNTLGTIVEKQTGKKIGEAFYEGIASQIGMQDFQPADVTYFYDKVSIHPAYLFNMSARDMARFGLLYMREGEWGGKRILTREWVADSTRAYSDARPGVGYGYMWWVAKGALLGSKINVAAYRAEGNGGQYIVVIPAYKLVVVHLANFDTSKVNSNPQFGQLMKLLLEARTGG